MTVPLYILAVLLGCVLFAAGIVIGWTARDRRKPWPASPSEALRYLAESDQKEHRR